jgi:hypothetical protein
MVARTRIEPDIFVVQFDRDGEEPQKELVVGNGQRVLLHAVGILISRRELRLHDRLMVRAAEEGVDVPA